MQQVGQWVFHLYAHQRRRLRIGAPAQQRKVQVVRDAVAVGHQLERTEFGGDLALVHALDGVLIGKPICDQVGDRAHLQPMLAREHFQLRATRHAAVRVEHFHQHTGRFQSGQHRQIAGRFGVAGTGQHATGLGDQREDMPGLAQILWPGIRADCGAHGVRAVVGRNAGGHPFGRFDADSEVGLELRGVVAHHRRQTQLRAALAGQRQAHQPARVGDHEVDVRRLHQLGGHDQIAFVFAVFVIDDDHHASGAQFFDQFRNGREIHAAPRVPSRRST